MRELTIEEVENISGGINGGYVLVGTLAMIAGGALTVAGLGTPISIGGAALAALGTTYAALGMLEVSPSITVSGGGTTS
jgi:hypothetical protein